MIRSKTFRNVRARLLRTSDGTWHSGWALHLTQDEARIRLQNFISFEQDAHLVGEFYGDGTLARCSGKVIGQAGQDIAVALERSLTFEPSTNTVRFQVEDCIGTLKHDTGPAELIAMDVSPRSLGGLSSRNFAPGTVLSLDLKTHLGRFQAQVGVVNCRSVDANTGYFRIGLDILDAARLERALWNRFVAERAEA